MADDTKTRRPPDAPRVMVRDSVAIQYPMWGRGQKIYYGAEKGMVKWEEEDTGKFGSMMWKVAADRILSLSEMVYKSSEDGYYRDEVRRAQQFICEMEAVIRTAKEQGGPFDEDGIKENIRRRPKSVVMPKEIDLSF